MGRLPSFGPSCLLTACRGVYRAALATMGRWGRGCLVLVLVLTQTGCASVLYFPSREMERTPAAAQLAYRDVTFNSLDGTPLHGWWLPAAGEVVGTVLFFHGNAQNISTNLAAVYWLPERGFNVLLFDYRGFGRSAGAPTMGGIRKDGRAALRYARSHTERGKLVVFGQSIGGAIAIDALGREGTDGIAAVAIDSSFASYRAITREKLGQLWLTWPFQWPLSLLMPDRYSPNRVVDRIGPVPLLILHGEADRVVPIHHGEALFDRASAPKRMIRVPGGRHISALGMKNGPYRDQLTAFFSQALRGTP